MIVMQDPHLFFVSSFFPPALTPPTRLIFLYAPESPPSLRETGDLRAQGEVTSPTFSVSSLPNVGFSLSPSAPSSNLLNPLPPA